MKKMLKRKKRLFQRAGASKIWSPYRKFQKHCKQVLRRAEWQYINSTKQEGLNKHDTKLFWRFIKSRKQDSTGVAPLKEKGKLHSESQPKADILLKQFKSVFIKASNTPLKEKGQLHSESQPKADILLKQFKSVFIKASNTPLKEKGKLHSESQPKADILLKQFKSVFIKASNTPLKEKGQLHSESQPKADIPLETVQVSVYQGLQHHPPQPGTPTCHHPNHHRHHPWCSKAATHPETPTCHHPNHHHHHPWCSKSINQSI
ncbi:hypothetical protein V1264_015804 [Littorina saxatilis]|uniref:Uncharacterized protein n=1 Tax=Littorina saxatilis TaxID=31220 RepID=A0AAN9BML3_9CAEN